MPLSPTARQAELLKFLQGFTLPPTYSEMARALGFPRNGKSTVHRLLTALEERGLIRREGYRHGSRGQIHITARAPKGKRFTRAEGLAFARKWRAEMKPYFDAVYGPNPSARYPLSSLPAVAHLRIAGRIT